MISNLGAESTDVLVTPRMDKVNLTNNAEAINAITGEKLPIKNGSFNVNLASFDYALVWVK